MDSRKKYEIRLEKDLEKQLEYYIKEADKLTPEEMNRPVSLEESEEKGRSRQTFDRSIYYYSQVASGKGPVGPTGILIEPSAVGATGPSGFTGSVSQNGVFGNGNKPRSASSNSYSEPSRSHKSTKSSLSSYSDSGPSTSRKSTEIPEGSSEILSKNGMSNR
jgi:hypothetical protein